MRFKITSLSQRNRILKELFENYKIKTKNNFKKYQTKQSQVDQKFETEKKETMDIYNKFIDRFGKFRDEM